MAHTAATVTWTCVSEVSGICIDVDLPHPIIQVKVVIGQAGYPAVACSVQLGCCQDID